MQFSDITPSLAQALHLKKLEQEGNLDTDKIEELMSQEKPNQVEKSKFNAERFEAVFPKNRKRWKWSLFFWIWRTLEKYKNLWKILKNVILYM